MHLLRVETDAFAARSDLATLMRGAWSVVPVALVVDFERGVGLRVCPARVPLDRHACGADHLVLRQVQRDLVGGELAVELAGWIERVIFPAVLVVHHDFRIPLREVEAPAPPSLPPRQRRGAGLPRDVDDARIAGRQCTGQSPVRDRGVGGVGVVGQPALPHHRRASDALERVVGVFEMLESVALLRRVDRGPAGSGAEGVQVLVDVEIMQRIGGAVHVADAHMPREHPGRLVQGSRDAIRDLLLPVARGIAGCEQKEDWEHGGGEATASRA